MKRKRQKVFIVILILIAVVTGINYYFRPFYNKYQKIVDEREKEVLPKVEPTPTAAPLPYEKFINEASSRDKITQLIAAPLTVSKDEEVMEEQLNWLVKEKVGLAVVFGERLQADYVQETINKIEENFSSLSYSPLIAVDHEGGRVQRLSGKGYEILPAWRTLCQQDKKKIQEKLTASAKELAETGINIVFAPMLDLANSNSVLKDRVCSDEEKLQQAASIYIQSFGSVGVMPVVKHFPGIGQVGVDLHKDFATIPFSEKEGLLFKNTLDAYPNIGVMTAHIGIKNYFDDRPCSLSQECLANIQEVYPNVILITDALDMDSAASLPDDEGELSLSQRAELAIIAGNNILVFGKDVDFSELSLLISELTKKYENDNIFKERVDNSLRKILSIKQLNN